jgi:hypothetical protein
MQARAVSTAYSLHERTFPERLKTVFPHKGEQMSVVVLPIFAIAVYLGIWTAGVRRRNAQTWDALLSRLRPDWKAEVNDDQSLWREGLNATPEDAWQRIGGASGLCAMYQNAGVMLEIAHYASRNSVMVDRQLLEALARDAMHIRVHVLVALGQYAFIQINVNKRLYAFHAATLYAEMAARMVQLLQAEAASMVPDFVAAM